MFEKFLQEIGLSEKEAALYLALVQVDNASVIDLSKKTGINRSTVYVVLEGLMKKGLATEVRIGKKVHYQAESPERLSTFIERQKVMLEEHGKRLADIVPQIKGLQREQGQRPVMKYFDGREAALNSNREFFNIQDKEGVGYFFFNRDLIEEIFSQKELDEIQKIRPSKNIKGKSLYVGQTTLSSNEMTERKKIDGEKYPVLCDVSIYEDRVQFVTLGKKLSSIFIQSKDVAETLKSLFKLAFDNLPQK